MYIVEIISSCDLSKKINTYVLINVHDLLHYKKQLFVRITRKWPLVFDAEEIIPTLLLFTSNVLLVE